jgi:ketosteroid isomerase-like protein
MPLFVAFSISTGFSCIILASNHIKMRIPTNLYILNAGLFLMVLSTLSCHDYTQRETNDQSAELHLIEQAIRGSIGWAKNKDFDLLYSIIADDSNYLEVDPGHSLIVGIEQFKKNEKLWGSPDFKAIRYDFRDLKITLSQSGEVAWYYCILNDINEWKGQPLSWENVRWTGILEKRKGKWVIVQMHFSFPEDPKNK